VALELGPARVVATAHARVTGPVAARVTDAETYAIQAPEHLRRQNLLEQAQLGRSPPEP
jgi:hypothetical protein